MIRFTLPGEPLTATHHRKILVRAGRTVRMIDAKPLKQARQAYQAMLLPYKPEHPLTGPLKLELIFCFGYLSNHSKRFKESLKWKHTRPDLSNLVKTFEDCLMCMGFFVDDGQICDLKIKKVFSESPGIVVVIDHADDSELL